MLFIKGNKQRSFEVDWLAKAMDKIQGRSRNRVFMVKTEDRVH